MTLETRTYNSNERNGMTFYVAPSWVTDTVDGGYPYYRAVDVATGRTLLESDDVRSLVRAMATMRPEMTLLANSVTASHGVTPEGSEVA